ncbi:TPA: hypothetical protein ACH3X1_009399 [Trebouxia sp. C0004]
MTLQAQLQQLSQQVNQQVCVYTDRGFDIKDVGSGMTHAYGREGGEYILHITILLSASTPAFHNTAKLDSLLSFAAPESQQAFSCSDSISSSTDTVGSSSTVSESQSTPRPDKGVFGSITQLRQCLHCSTAPDAGFSDTHPVTPDLGPRHPHLLPTPRLVSVQAHDVHHAACDVVASQAPSVSHSQQRGPHQSRVPHPDSISPEMQAGIPVASSSDSHPYLESTGAQWQLQECRQLKLDNLPEGLASVLHNSSAQVNPESPVLPSSSASPLPSNSDALLSSSSSSSGRGERGSTVLGLAQADAQEAPHAILVTNDLFQHLSEQCQQPDDGLGPADPTPLHLWQANGIFDSQASLLDTAAHIDAWSPQQHSSVLHSRRSTTDCNSRGDAQQYPSSIDHAFDEDQHQVFSGLFDTQLSQFLSTHEEALTLSAELQASGTPDSDLVLSQAPHSAVPDSASLYSYMADSESADSVSIHGQVVDLAPADTASVPSPILQAAPVDPVTALEGSLLASLKPTPSATSSSILDSSRVLSSSSSSSRAEISSVGKAACKPAEALTSALDAAQLASHAPEGDKHEPVTIAVSTAQLEVMGWDMFADTLDTFRLLSDSDAESTTNLLPEPAELCPITPEMGLHEPRLTQQQVAVDSPLMYDSPVLGDHENQDSPGVWHSQDLAHFDLPDGLEDENTQDAPSDKYVCNSPMSPLEWEYHAMMLNEHCLSERYPGMHSDAREFDGRGCLGNNHSCAARSEECMTCYPCATCACYPTAPLQSGRHHRKSVIKRLWASMKAKGSACIHPKIPHERYS